MSTTPSVQCDPRVVDVVITDEMLSVALADGRKISAPLVWFPRLINATPEQRVRWEPCGGGYGIHWEAVDEDISVASLLAPGETVP